MFGLIKESAGPLLRQVKVLDVYKGKQIAQGFKSITVSCLYLAQDRTLTEEEINPLHSCVSKALIDKLGVQIR